MRKTLLFWIFGLLIMSCGTSPQEQQKGYYQDQIADWQVRERESLPYTLVHTAGSEADLAIVSETSEWVYRYVRYVRDEGDYWQTSSETLQWWEGDCEDTAILIYRKLRESGIPDNLIGIIVYHIPGTGMHASAYVLHNGEFLLVDKKYPLLPLSDLDIEIYAMFNLFENANLTNPQ